MLGGLLGVALGPVLAHLWESYSDTYRTYGRLYFLTLPPELVGLYVLRTLRAGGSGALEKWGFRLSLAGLWLMVLGVFTDYWVDVFPGLLAQMVAAPVLLAGFLVLSPGLRKGRGVPRWVALAMVGVVVLAVPVTLVFVNHMPGGPLLLLHAAWVALGYVLFSGRGAVTGPTNPRAS